MKKNLLIITVMIVLLVVVFFTYDIVKGIVSPCDTIFEQTSVQLGGKLKLVQTEGEVFIGKEKVQELTENAQIAALNLKTCCIVLNAGEVDSDQFLQCRNSAKQYEEKIDTMLEHIQKAEVAKKAGKAKSLEENIRAIHSSIIDVESFSKTLEIQVKTLSTDQQSRPPENGMGKIITSDGSFVFSQIKGMSMSQGKLTVSQFGAKVEIPLSTISRVELHQVKRIEVNQDSMVTIKYVDGRNEETKLSCYWNFPATFISGDKEIHYEHCSEFNSVKVIEFYHSDEPKK